MSAPSGLTTAGVVPGELTTTLNVDLKIEGDKVSFEGTDKRKVVSLLIRERLLQAV